MTTPTVETPIIPNDAIERAIAVQLERSEALKGLSELPAQFAKLAADRTAEEQRNMEYREKLDRMQFAPTGAVPQLGNFNPAVDRAIDLGKILRLTQQDDTGFPQLGAADTTLEESVIERADLGNAGRNTVARIPWLALEEREKQLRLQRATMADASGSRPIDHSPLGDGGLILSSWSPILARMDARFGVSGSQKSPWATSQPTAAAGAEGSDITVSNLVLSDTEYLPKSIASAYELTTSLRGVDDGTFEGIARMAITDVLLDQVTGQVLDGGGGNEIAGIWGTTGVPNFDYGAAQSDFTRQDVLDFFDSVRLSKADGGMFTAILGTDLWKLCESVLRGGAASDMYLLEAMPSAAMETMMGMMEGVATFHYADLSPSGVTDAGLMLKANRQIVWFWGDSLALEYVPTLTRKESFKMVAECNSITYRPVQNTSRIKQT